MISNETQKYILLCKYGITQCNIKVKKTYYLLTYMINFIRLLILKYLILQKYNDSMGRCFVPVVRIV